MSQKGRQRTGGPVLPRGVVSIEIPRGHLDMCARGIAAARARNVCAITDPQGRLRPWAWGKGEAP
jgi:hypothetical protein